MVDMEVAEKDRFRRRQIDACFGKSRPDPAAGVEQEPRLPVGVDDVTGVRSAVRER